MVQADGCTVRSAVMVGSEMRRRRLQRPVRSAFARCRATTDSGSSGQVAVGDGICATVGWLAALWQAPICFLGFMEMLRCQTTLLLSGLTRQYYSLGSPTNLLPLLRNDNYPQMQRRRRLLGVLSRYPVSRCVRPDFSSFLASSELAGCVLMLLLVVIVD